MIIPDRHLHLSGYCVFKALHSLFWLRKNSFYFYNVDYIAKMKYNKVIYYVQKEFVYGR